MFPGSRLATQVIPLSPSLLVYAYVHAANIQQHALCKSASVRGRFDSSCLTRYFPPLQPLDLGRRSRTSESAPAELPQSTYTQGAHLKRVRTRSSADTDIWLPVLEQHPGPLATKCAPIFGAPLTRVQTRMDSSCLWDDPKKSTQAALRSSAKSDDELLYEDDFVALTANRLVVRHLLYRNAVAFDLSEIRRARPFCTAARLVQLEAQHILDGETGRPAGISNGGLGATGIIWARDRARIAGEHWKERAVVIHTGGVLGKVGFTVEHPEQWLRAFEAVRTLASTASIGPLSR